MPIPLIKSRNFFGSGAIWEWVGG